jgi:hypothetical protein
MPPHTPVAAAGSTPERQGPTRRRPMVVVPMLDHGTAMNTHLDAAGHLVWDNRANRYGWVCTWGGLDRSALPLTPPRATSRTSPVCRGLVVRLRRRALSRRGRRVRQTTSGGGRRQDTGQRPGRSARHQSDLARHSGRTVDPCPGRCVVGDAAREPNCGIAHQPPPTTARAYLGF